MSDPFLSVNEYPGNGVTTEFNISFAGGYISRDHVRVAVIAADGETATEPAFTWVGDTQISIVPAPAAGTTVKIYRETPNIVPLVDFADGAVINEDTLDTNAKQAVFLAAELRDRIGTIPGWDDILIATGNAEAATALLTALLDEITLYGLAKVYGTWVELNAVIGQPGATALVVIQDGTHTDPVSAANVNNAGFYKWNVSPAGWNRFADTQASIATNAATDAAGYATALAVGTAGGWYDSLAAGAADPAVAEGDGYFYLTGDRFYIGQKVGGVGVQKAEFLTSAGALAATLTPANNALGSTTPASDKLPYFTGPTSATTTTLTSAARGLLAQATKADMRTELGVAIGTDVQAHDADLAAIAALTTSPFGRSLLELATASAGRTALEIVLTGDGTSGKLAVGTFALTWRRHSIANNSTAAYGYGSGHSYTSWANAWIEGDDGAGDRSFTVTSSGLSSATVRSNGNVTANGTLFCIGV